mgnify:CR=1 FL=1
MFYICVYLRSSVDYGFSIVLVLVNFCPVCWPRAIALIDMNAFFASVDQRDFPSLLGQPVAITNGPVSYTHLTLPTTPY